MLSVTPQERLALGVTALLLAAGAGVRIATPPAAVHWEQKEAAASDTQEGDPSATRRAAAEALARERVRAMPLADGERVDLNRATADEIDRLPRIGPALAAKIVEWRTARGPFRSLSDLDSVPGVGPALLREVEPRLKFGPVAGRAGAARRPSAIGSAAALDLNRATAAELDALPGIGPVLARRIIDRREEKGRFRSVEELEQVPGIGSALVKKLGASIRAGP